jgi:hypothetical protein
VALPHPPRGLIAMIGAVVYLASPIDVLPEVMLGPLGLLDDAGAVTAAAIFVYKSSDGQEATPGCGREGPAEARSAGVTASLMLIPSGINGTRSLSYGAFQYFTGFIELLASVMVRQLPDRWDRLS